MIEEMKHLPLMAEQASESCNRDSFEDVLKRLLDEREKAASNRITHLLAPVSIRPRRAETAGLFPSSILSTLAEQAAKDVKTEDKKEDDKK
ncbi:hypothetical protein [Nitrososphaera viennensis]|uniref:Uncharacterized protein n=1 Tax=Nitrososphaera viennensis TaxID=1034015 RepID=A0A977ICY6_9ARCH|nr:hypothetical protein [Nitrososphaera viennensis]UVS68653.1 hypothetical protein NWT39_12200 [Nitrososphaera viennensis]